MSAKRSRIAVAALAILMATTAAADARVSTSRNVTLTQQFRALVAPSSHFVATGTLASRAIGNGAVIRQVTTTPSGLSVAFTLYTARGSLKGTSTETRTMNSDGSFSFKVTKAAITGGSGRYAHARGRLTGSGTEPNGSSPVTLELHGTISW